MLTFCESQLKWMVEEVELLARAESPSSDKPAVDRCGELLADLLARWGGRVERIRRPSAGDHVRAEFGDGDRQVLLLGHFDTVWPVGEIARMPVRLDGDRLHGPGVFDMKGGLVIALAAMRALADARAASGLRRVLLFTTDEEIGSRTSRELIESEARRSDAVLVLEPSLPGGAVKTSRKTVGEFLLTVRGVAAHAGIAPGQGASAIHELSRQIVELLNLQDAARGISVNVGVVSGGTRSNVVAEDAYAMVDIRAPRMDDARRLEETLRRLTAVDGRTQVSVQGSFDRPPLERTAAVARLYEIASQVARELGRTLEEGGTGGGSDGSFTAALGIPTLDGLGAVGDGAHAAHEHILVRELPWRAALVAGLVDRIAKDGKIRI